MHKLIENQPLPLRLSRVLNWADGEGKHYRMSLRVWKVQTKAVYIRLADKSGFNGNTI